MPSSGMLGSAALVRTGVSKENIASIIKVKRIGELRTTLAVTNNRSTLRVVGNVAPSSPILLLLMMEALRSSETSIPTRATRRKVSQDSIHHSHRRENLKFYIAFINRFGSVAEK
jgi:hypothetical protein